MLSITEIDSLLSVSSDVAIAGSQRSRWARKQMQQDRYIPAQQSQSDAQSAQDAVAFALRNSACDSVACNSPSKVAFKAALAQSQEISAIASSEAVEVASKILTFTRKPAARPAYQPSELNVLYSGSSCSDSPSEQGFVSKKTTQRFVCAGAEKVLDAPGLVNDYYLNLLSWGANNELAVALGQDLFIWSAASGSIVKLFSNGENNGEEDMITSVEWLSDGAHLAVGNTKGDVLLWDVERQKQVRCMKGHAARVGAIAANNGNNGFILASGSKDTSIFLHDVRQQVHHTATLQGHCQEICGLKWSPNGSQLASGGNDNVVNVWEPFSQVSNNSENVIAPKFTMTHNAAVRALAFCPWQNNVLATGGGAADRCIKIWNTANGQNINTIDTNAQVTSLQFSTSHRELLSAHGYAHNQLNLWKFPTMEKVTQLKGHTARILSTATSPDGSVVVSAGADETLRFWRIWSPENSTASSNSSSSLRMGCKSSQENASCIKNIR